MNHPFVFEQERRFGQLISDTFLFVRLNAKQLTLSLCILVLPFSLLSGYFYAKIQYSLLTASETTPSVMVSVLYYLSALCTQAILIATTNSYIILFHQRKGSNFSFIDLEQFALSRFFNHLLAFVGVFFILLIGFLLLIVPGIWATMPLMMLFFVMLFEQQPFHVSVQKSFFLVKDYWWQTFGRMLSMWLLSSLVGLIFFLPEFVVTLMLSIPEKLPFHFSVSENTFVIITTASQGIFSLFSALVYIAVALQYFHLSQIKAGKVSDF